MKEKQLKKLRKDAEEEGEKSEFEVSEEERIGLREEAKEEEELIEKEMERREGAKEKEKGKTIITFKPFGEFEKELEEGVGGLLGVQFKSEKHLPEEGKSLKKYEKDLKNLEKQLKEEKKNISIENKELIKEGKEVQQEINALESDIKELRVESFNTELSLEEMRNIDEQVDKKEEELLKLRNRLEYLNEKYKETPEERIRVGKISIGEAMENLQEIISKKFIITKTEMLSQNEKKLFEQQLKSWYEELKKVRDEMDYEKGGVGKKRGFGSVGVLSKKDIDVNTLFCIIENLQNIDGKYYNLRNVIYANKDDVSNAMKACVLREIYITYPNSNMYYLLKPRVKKKKIVEKGEVSLSGGEFSFETEKVIPQYSIVWEKKGKKRSKLIRLSREERWKEEVYDKWMKPIENVKTITDLEEGYAILVPITSLKSEKVEKVTLEEVVVKSEEVKKKLEEEKRELKEVGVKSEEDVFELFRELKKDIDYELEKPVSVSTLQKLAKENPLITIKVKESKGQKKDIVETYDALHKAVEVFKDVNKEIDERLLNTYGIEDRNKLVIQKELNELKISQFIHLILKGQYYIPNEKLEQLKKEKDFQKFFLQFKEEEAYQIPMGTTYKYLPEEEEIVKKEKMPSGKEVEVIKTRPPVVVLPKKEPVLSLLKEKENEEKIIGLGEDIPEGWAVEKIVVTGSSPVVTSSEIENIAGSITGEESPYKRKKNLLKELKKRQIKSKSPPLKKRLEAFKNLADIRKERLFKLNMLLENVVLRKINIKEERMKDKERKEEETFREELIELDEGHLYEFGMKPFIRQLKRDIRDLKRNIENVRTFSEKGQLYNILPRYVQISAEEYKKLYPAKLLKEEIGEIAETFSNDLNIEFENKREKVEKFVICPILREDVPSILEYEESLVENLNEDIENAIKQKDEDKEVDLKVKLYDLKKSIDELRKGLKTKKEALALKVLVPVLSYNISSLAKKYGLKKKGIPEEEFKEVEHELTKTGNFFMLERKGNATYLYRKPFVVSPFKVAGVELLKKLSKKK